MHEAAIGRREQHPVEHTLIGAQLDAAGHCGIEFARLFADPRDGRAGHGFGIADRVIGETAGEGFRQHHQVGGAMQRRDQLAVVGAIAGGVVPAGFALDDGDAEVVHSACNRWMAASIVASFLAKHRRARRWPAGGVS